MANVVMDKDMRQVYMEAVQKLDSDVREIEEIHKEMDNYLYDIEKRIARLRRSGRD
jgi:hypothetical protein